MDDYGFDVTTEQEEELKRLTFVLATEERVWQENQISPQMINQDIYFLSAQIFALWSLIGEIADMDKADIEIKFKAALIEKMRADRKLVLKAKKDFEKAQKAGMLIAKKQMLGPDGNPMQNGA